MASLKLLIEDGGVSRAGLISTANRCGLVEAPPTLRKQLGDKLQVISTANRCGLVEAGWGWWRGWWWVEISTANRCGLVEAQSGIEDVLMNLEDLHS